MNETEEKKARPASDRVTAYQEWLVSVAPGNEGCWEMTEREKAVAYAAYFAGWMNRTHDKP
jgi:hypothetical protein